VKVRLIGSDEIIDLPEGHTMSMGYLPVKEEELKKEKPKTLWETLDEHWWNNWP
jgi:hypothetical protein